MMLMKWPLLLLFLIFLNLQMTVTAESTVTAEATSEEGKKYILINSLVGIKWKRLSRNAHYSNGKIRIRFNSALPGLSHIVHVS